MKELRNPPPIHGARFAAVLVLLTAILAAIPSVSVLRDRSLAWLRRPMGTADQHTVATGAA